MKKIVGVILLALVLTLAMAVPVMATTEGSGSTGVTVDIEDPSIEITAPSNIILGSSVVQGGTYDLVGTGNGKVKCNAPLGYTVTMSRGSPKMQGASEPLANALEAVVPGSGHGSITDIGPDIVVVHNGPCDWNAPDTFTLNVQQQIVPGDQTGVYSITITFTGTCN